MNENIESQELSLGWIGCNLFIQMVGYRALDPPPFAWLELAASLVALYMTVLILTTQRREDQLAQHREQLTLELAILSETKTAKITSTAIEILRASITILNKSLKKLLMVSLSEQNDMCCFGGTGKTDRSNVYLGKDSLMRCLTC